MAMQGLQVAMFLLISLVVQGQVEVVVRDADSGEPLAFAEVQDQEEVTWTDEDGTILLEAGTSVRIRYLGYETRVVMIPASDAPYFVGLQPASQLLDQVIITGNKAGERLMDAIAPLDILPLDLVEQRSTPDLSSLLNRMPGVQMVDGQISIRSGAGYAYGAGSRVAVLLNQMPMIQPDAGSVAWSDMPMELIQTTEILKSAGSTLYGSSALNGVVQMNTWPHLQDTSYSKIVLATRGIGKPANEKYHWYDGLRNSQWGHWVHHDLKGKFQWQSSLRFENQLNHIQDFFENRGRLAMNAKYKLNRETEIGMNTLVNVFRNQRYLYWKNADEGAMIGAVETQFQNRIRRVQIDPYYKYISRSGSSHFLQARLFFSENRADDQLGSSVDQYLLNYRYTTPLGRQKGRWVMGAIGQGFLTRAELFGNRQFWSYNAAVFSQFEYSIFDELKIMGGGRMELNGQFPGQITVNGENLDGDILEWEPIFTGGLNYNPWQGTSISFHYAEGYRFPTIAEKFIQTTQAGAPISPNPAIQSETGQSYNLSWKQAIVFSGFQSLFRTDLFLMQYQEMIEFGFRSLDLGFQAMNVGATDVRGLEVSWMAELDLDDLHGTALIGYTYSYPTYQEFTEDLQARSSVDYNFLKYRVRHQVTSQIGMNWNGFQLGIAGLYNSPMEAIDGILELIVIDGLREYRTEQSTAFFRLDLSVGYQWKQYRLLVDVQNVLNEEYTLRPGMLEPPVNASVQLEYSF